MFSKKLFLPLSLFLLLVPCACTEDETDLGMSLQDPFTLYQGIRDTIQPVACTILDDSLSTVGYAAGVFGDYSDADFGSMKAILYSQIAAPNEGINITDAVVIDSVVMTLVIDTVYPVMPDSTPRTFHVIVNQLAETFKPDSSYTSTKMVPESDVCFFNDEVTYYADSVRLRLNENIYPVLRQSCTYEDFFDYSKGIAIKLADNSQTAVTVDISASNTRLTLYYHTDVVDSTLQFAFTINSAAGHSMYYSHDYSGTALAPFATNRNDSISGTDKLYLEPLGGTRLRLNLQSFLNRFRKDHPAAVVHYAELLLPVSASATDTSVPVRILALKNYVDGTSTYVTDANVLTNTYTYGGFDGYYDREKKQYRLRVTRHLQELLRSGEDYGTELVIDARRSSAFRTIIGGTASADPSRAIRIEFIYSE